MLTDSVFDISPKKSKTKNKFDELCKHKNFTVTNIDEYVNNASKIDIICSHGHKFSTSYTLLKLLKNCPTCKKHRARDRFFHLLKTEKYIPTDPFSYIDTQKHLEITCPNGHMYRVTAANFESGYRCRKCANNCSEEGRKNFIKLADERLFIIIDITKYKNRRSKISALCPNGHECEITPASFIKGIGCKKCSKTCPTDAAKRFYQNIKKMGYELAINEQYRNCKTLVKLKCKKHGTFSARPMNIKDKVGCPQCSKTGFDPGKSAILYYIKFFSKNAISQYKIGITNRPLNKRHPPTKNSYEVIWVKKFSKGSDAYHCEQKAISFAKTKRSRISYVKDVSTKELFDENVFPDIDHLINILTSDIL
jgi:hypothetical protein